MNEWKASYIPVLMRQSYQSSRTVLAINEQMTVNSNLNALSRLLYFYEVVNDENHFNIIFSEATALQYEGMQITLQSKADTVKIAVENTFNYCIRKMFMSIYG
uniref:Uncharacterized protein n=1 Tax=Glossina austeni TaxID=7395 RepID=A0A1A9UYK7_GLOAU